MSDISWIWEKAADAATPAAKVGMPPMPWDQPRSGRITVAAAPKMVSGRGQYHTNEPDAKSRKPYVYIDLAGIRFLVDNPQSIDKTQAQWLIPSTLPSRNFAKQEQNGEFHMLWSDLDANPKPISEVAAILRQTIIPGCDFELYASKSACEDYQKARILIPLEQPLSGADWRLCQELLGNALEQAGIAPDRAAERPAQLCYLPNRGAFYEAASERSGAFFDPLATWASELAARRAAIEAQAAELTALARAASERRAALKVGDAPDNTIGAFNRAYTVAEILLRANYAQRGNTFRHPDSESGSFSASVKDGRVHSLSSSDPLYTGGGGGGAHHAFSAFTVLWCGGDRDTALKLAGDEWLAIGVESWNKARQREYAQAKSASEATTDGGASSGQADAISYPEPIPLPKLPPVPDFPLDILPDAFEPWIKDASKRARFRPDFAAVGMMVSLGSVIGRKIGIRLKKRDDWTEHANVWGGIVGPPSSLKSPAARESMRQFKHLQINADIEYAKRLADYEKEDAKFKMRKEAKKKASAKALRDDPDGEIEIDDAEGPEKPVQRIYWTSNVTVERLGELLSVNPNGLLVERDELASLLVSLEDERNADARGMYLSGWSGQEGYVFDRIMRGRTSIPKYALSVFGGIQPGPLARYVRGAFSGERADGLLQRFQLLVWPDSETFEYVDQWPDKYAKAAANDVYERADTFDAIAMGAVDGFGNEPPIIRLSDEAQGIFVEWYTQFMQSSRSADSGMSAPLAAHFGKYPGLVGKLALILHVADDPAAKEVSARTLAKALSWIAYLTPHARRVYHATEHPETGVAELLIARLHRGELPDKFKVWEISRKGWHGLSDNESVKKACRLLFEHGWLIEKDAEVSKIIGRPADTIYAVSPAVKLKK